MEGLLGNIWLHVAEDSEPIVLSEWLLDAAVTKVTISVGFL